MMNGKENETLSIHPIIYVYMCICEEWRMEVSSGTNCLKFQFSHLFLYFSE